MFHPWIVLLAVHISLFYSYRALVDRIYFLGRDDAEELHERCTTWNQLLQARLEEWANTTPKATIFLFSAYHMLSQILDEAREEEDSIWEDEIHVTDAAQAMFARDSSSNRTVLTRFSICQQS